MTRHEIQTLYVRVCRDSGYRLPYDRAAALVSDMIGAGTALEIWLQFSSVATMMEIAEGRHPICGVKGDPDVR